jgi:hypothetical protein
MENTMKLSNEAVGALMMALQKCLLAQSDITDILKSMDFTNSNGQLYVMNPPLVKFELEELSEEDLQDQNA